VTSLDGTWRKSSRSNTNGACVEVRRDDASVQVRDSKDQAGPVLAFPAGSWQDFVADLAEGRFDRP
jgi:hypothetical protein